LNDAGLVASLSNEPPWQAKQAADWFFCSLAASAAFALQKAIRKRARDSIVIAIDVFCIFIISPGPQYNGYETGWIGEESPFHPIVGYPVPVPFPSNAENNA